ncbi:MAG: cob(I)yrinic acid a,c-diamide adenosyltransferase [Tissierellales bacterium]|jgi:cob(I)alamin adenosyltransferase|nr:cob(I)yrinic acid a,c-diamide adenosyltransferase [Tissierellales bacterium]
MERGYIHIYTGDGKGKTTAAFGVALRTLLCDKRVFVGQFVKSMAYSETNITRWTENIEIEQFGCGCMLDREKDEEDIKHAKQGLVRCREIFEKNEYDLIILDEIFIAIDLGLVTQEEVEKLMSYKPEYAELILTGRNAPEALIAKADLVTEMKCKKHYYEKGVLSRAGIDC